SLGRLTAAAIAIVISTAFVAATLLASNVLTRTTYDAVTTTYAEADLVVTQGELVDKTVETVRETDGVAAVAPYLETWSDLSGPDGLRSMPVRPVAPDPRLESASLSEGVLPTST